MTDDTTGISVIVIGASAGGVEALVELVRGLPSDLPAAVCIVVHFPIHSHSRLPEILNRAGPLRAEHAGHGQPLERGRIYVASPDRHMLVARGRLLLVGGPRYNGSRPAIDPLFRTAARTYGPQCIGVLLSGTLDDGVAGFAAIHAAGGLTVVQDPNEALFDFLPRGALENVSVDAVLPAAQIGAELGRLAARRAATPAPEIGLGDVAEDLENLREARLVAEDKAALERGERHNEPSMLTCPDCGGALWELHDHNLLRYRCHVGHTFTLDGLRAAQQEALEGAW